MKTKQKLTSARKTKQNNNSSKPEAIYAEKLYKTCISLTIWPGSPSVSNRSAWICKQSI